MHQDSTSSSKTCPICGRIFDPHPTESRYAFRKRVTCGNSCGSTLNKQTATQKELARRREASPAIGVVPLANGKYAYVDPEDFDRVMNHLWRTCVQRDVTYAESAIDGHRVRMHNFILGPVEGEIDHKDGDGLNNRRSNLRPTTHSQNIANQRMRKTNTSGYKGVSRDKKGWQVVIGHEGKQYRIGNFSTKIEAAQAYDNAARRLFGEFASLNFPQPGERSAREGTIEPC
jgi:hypothetical protein